jgi:C4-type Zn-finger protein
MNLKPTIPSIPCPLCERELQPWSWVEVKGKVSHLAYYCVACQWKNKSYEEEGEKP